MDVIFPKLRFFPLKINGEIRAQIVANTLKTKCKYNRYGYEM